MPPPLSDEEIIRRVFILRPLLTSDKPLIPGRNVDLTGLPEQWAKIQPSIAHTITQCLPCGADIWLGPSQLAADGIRMCYVCLAVSQQLLPAENAEFQTLDPDADSVPRRLPG